MISLLKSLCGRKDVCVYTNQNDTQKFHFGEIICVNEFEIALRVLSLDGSDDGIIAFATQKVYRVDIDTLYAKKMNLLVHNTDIKKIHHNLSNDSIFKSLLAIAEHENEIVSIELLGSGIDDIVGFVERISENNIVEFAAVDAYGFKEGTSFVDLNDITQISFASESEIRIKQLFDLQNEN